MMFSAMKSHGGRWMGHVDKRTMAGASHDMNVTHAAAFTSKQTGPRKGPFLKSGGEDRNRTCLGGFAGRCITSLLPRQNPS